MRQRRFHRVQILGLVPIPEVISRALAAIQPIEAPSDRCCTSRNWNPVCETPGKSIRRKEETASLAQPSLPPYLRQLCRLPAVFRVCSPCTAGSNSCPRNSLHKIHHDGPLLRVTISRKRSGRGKWRPKASADIWGEVFANVLMPPGGYQDSKLTAKRGEFAQIRSVQRRSRRGLRSYRYEVAGGACRRSSTQPVQNGSRGTAAIGPAAGVIWMRSRTGRARFTGTSASLKVVSGRSTRGTTET